MKRACLPAAVSFALVLITFSVTSCSSSKKDKSIVTAPTLPEETILENAISTYDQELYKVSQANWTDLKDGYPTSYYSTFAELKVADTHFFSGDYPAALVAYEEFAKLHPGHESMSYVQYQIGNCHLKQYKGVKHDQTPLKAAITAFQQLIDSHPRSEYVVLARRQLHHCREFQAAYEQYVAGFYEKRGFDDAASSRKKSLSENFPDTEVVTASDISEASQTQPAFQPNGKLPTVPKIVEKSGLQSANYPSALSTIRGTHAEVHEENLMAAQAPAIPVSEVEDMFPNATESFECEETEEGNIFIVTMDSSVNSEPVRKDDELIFSFPKPIQAKKAEDHCSSGGVDVRLKSDSNKVTLQLPEGASERAVALVLNRPERIVLSIPK